MEEGQKIESPTRYSFSTHDEDYFVAPSDLRSSQRLELSMSLLVDKSKGFVTFKNEHECRFNWKCFSEFFFYHFMFFLVLGPLFPIVFWPILSVHMLKNMGFWGLDFVSILQFTIWLLNFIVILTLVINPEWNHESIVTSVDLYSLLVLTVVRIVTIASKYAAFTPEKLAYLRHNMMNFREKEWDLLVGDWRGQTNEKIIDEISIAVRRNEIDLNLLKINFLRSPDATTLARLVAKNELFKDRNKTLFGIKVEDHSKSSSITNPANSSEVQNENTIFGVAIIHDLIERYREQKNLRKLALICICLAFFRGAIPWRTYRLASDLGCWRSWSISILFTIVVIYLYLIITLFFAISDVDIRRKIFLETQLGYLITPRKFTGNDGDKKIFPTADFLCPKHLRSWNLLRKISRDYGSQYSMRESANLGCLAGIYLCFGVLLLLDFFNVIQISDFVKNTELVETLKIVISFDAIIFLILVMRELLLGLKLNKFYKIHKNSFEEMKIVISDIARKTEWYFGMNLTPKNFLYNFIVEHFKTKYKKGQNDLVDKKLEDLLLTMKEINRDLEFEEKYHSVTVLGFEPSSNLLQTIAIGLASLSFALIQDYFRKKTNYLRAFRL